MLAVIDYGVGNLFSVEKAFAYLGAEVIVTNSKEDLERADQIVLPGVGAFGDCMKNLNATGLIPTIKDQISRGKKFLGICVGLQILFESSEESPDVEGLKILEGKVKKIDAPGLKIPHMGWNSINARDLKIFKGLKNPYVYFVHSYHAIPRNPNLIIARAVYSKNITAAVRWKNVTATQFHPEKSGDVGLQILKNWIDSN
ncbi:MAG: imidazole glycerol phosphate synthase subunit HisH [Selenomonadaceae bacterium]|nr:imidazole glycerol phosphate synthase subunit HisH [Selenomonadaceae bacterium]